MRPLSHHIRSSGPSPLKRETGDEFRLARRS